MTNSTGTGSASRKVLAAHVVLVITLLIWSLSFLAAKWARQDLSVSGALAARFVPVLVGALLLAAFRWPLKIPRRSWGTIIWMGLLSVPIYNVFFFAGIKTVSSGTAALIIATNPAFTALLAWLMLGDPFGRRRTAGLLLATAGVFIVIRFGTTQQLGVDYWHGALLLLLAPLSWAFYTVLGKKLPPDCDRLDATLALLIIGSAPLLIFFTPTLIHQLHVHPLALWSSLYLGIFCTLFGFTAWLWALGRLSAGEVAAYVFLNPPLANLWAWLLDGTPLKPAFIGGALLLLAGVGLIVFGRRTSGRSA